MLDEREEVDLTVKMKLFNNFKAMLQFYPSKKSSFHITAGLMVGNEELFSAKGQFSDKATVLYNRYVYIKTDPAYLRLRQYGQIDARLGEATFTLADKTFELSRDGSVNLNIETNKVKPYFGVGFGKAIPQNRRVGFNFEMGVWYHGDVKITGDCRDATAAEMADGELQKEDFDIYAVKFIPTQTFRITGRIF